VDLGVANQRVHGTTHEQVLVRWDVEQFSLQSLAGQPPYPYVDGELRKVARDAYVTGKAAGIRCLGVCRPGRMGTGNCGGKWIFARAASGEQDPDSPATERAGGGEALAGSV